MNLKNAFNLKIIEDVKVCTGMVNSLENCAFERSYLIIGVDIWMSA